MSKVVIVTGASRGIGLAVTETLLAHPGVNVVVVARSGAPLDTLSARHQGRVEVVTGDLGADTTPSVVHEAVKRAIERWGRLDGLVLNHGTLDPVKRIADSSGRGWDRAFAVNLFSCVDFVRGALPHLRSAQGRVIFTSSGAAENAYAAWGAYGASKAALNHFCKTLATEEPGITAVSVRPGTVDTEMQRDLRDVHASKMSPQDAKKFAGLKEEGKLIHPQLPGGVIARLALTAEKQLSGKFLSWNAEELGAYQEI